MSSTDLRYDAIVVGAGPNGLAAAIELARHGKSVLLREAANRVGGSCASTDLTLPGFTHDSCSTVMAFAHASPLMRLLPLEQHGLELVYPPSPVGHPFDDGIAAVLERSVDATAATMGADAASYRALFEPIVRHWQTIAGGALDMRTGLRHPLVMARFGLKAIRSATGLAGSYFRTSHARGLFAGIAAHAILPLEDSPAAAFGLMLGAAAHADGWPIVRGGSQKLAEAMASYLRNLGGEIQTGAGGALRSDAPAARAHCGREASGAVSPPPRVLQVWAGGFQAGLGDGRASAMESEGADALRHGPSGRHARGDRPSRKGSCPRRTSGAAVRAAGAADAVRHHPCSGG